MDSDRVSRTVNVYVQASGPVDSFGEIQKKRHPDGLLVSFHMRQRASFELCNLAPGPGFHCWAGFRFYCIYTKYQTFHLLKLHL